MSFVLDSRNIQSGDTFIALNGAKVDGHLFLPEAARRGAVRVFVDTSYAGNDFGMELVACDVILTLQTMAREKIEKSGAHVVGVTGSVGKTTMKECIASVLSLKFDVMKSPSSQNSQVGLPVAVLNAADAEVMVLEMGMSKPGEMAKLTLMAKPHIVVIGKIALSHAENFSDLAEIAKAKAEILLTPRLKHLIVHEDSVRFIPNRDKVIYGPSSGPFAYDHFNENFAAAKAVGAYFDMSEIEMQKARVEPVERRFCAHQRGGFTFIDDSYNASRESMIAALKGVPKGKRVIGILGEMRELGQFSENEHRSVGAFAKGRLDRLIAVGQGTKPLVEAFGSGKIVASAKEAAIELRKVVKEGDVVLLKGANSLNLWQVMEAF